MRPRYISIYDESQTDRTCDNSTTYIFSCCPCQRRASTAPAHHLNQPETTRTLNLQHSRKHCTIVTQALGGSYCMICEIYSLLQLLALFSWPFCYQLTQVVLEEAIKWM